MGVIRLPEYLPPPPRRQSIPVPGMLHSAFLHLPFLGPPAFGCLGHGELARYCHGIAPVLRWCCDGVVPLGIPCTSLVHPLYLPSTPVGPSSAIRCLHRAPAWIWQHSFGRDSKGIAFSHESPPHFCPSPSPAHAQGLRISELPGHVPTSWIVALPSIGASKTSSCRRMGVLPTPGHKLIMVTPEQTTVRQVTGAWAYG